MGLLMLALVAGMVLHVVMLVAVTFERPPTLLLYFCWPPDFGCEQGWPLLAVKIGANESANSRR